MNRRCTWDFLPPEEYMSQAWQDAHEPAGGLQKLPQQKPFSLCDEVQFAIWDAGIRCDVELIRKEEKGSSFLSARLHGPLSERLLAKPIAQKWVNDLYRKQKKGTADD